MVTHKVVMRSCEKALSPLLRSLAAVALVIWIAAFALCTAHCTGFSAGHGNGDSARPSCHSTASAKTEHHDDGGSNDSEHCPSSTLGCAALQTAWLSGKAATVAPPSHVLYLLAPVVLVLDTVPDDAATLVFRQVTPRDWVFTPEVSLGPAFRSLAPPLT